MSAMKTTYLLIILTLITGCNGCTVRGGWPRFLRPGEASDRAIAKDERQRLAAETALPEILAGRDSKPLDLEAVGKDMVAKYGAWNAERAAWSLWNELTTNAPSLKVCDVTWLQDQSPRVRDVAWMLCYKAQWFPAKNL